MHTPMDDDRDPASVVRDALGLVRDLLSAAMRLRELRAGGWPYKWILEARVSGQWQTEQTMGPLVWNYFGARSKRIYQNAHLPERDE